MKEIVIGLILMFDTGTGQLVNAAVAAFDSKEKCEIAMERVRERSAQDLLVHIEGGCLEVAVQ